MATLNTSALSLLVVADPNLRTATMPLNITTSPTKLDGFVTIDDVTAATGYTRRSIHRFVVEGRFPPPIRLNSRRNVWRQSEVAAWLDAQEAEGRNKPTPKVCGA